MKGKHHVVVESSRLKYEFDVRRNITIIEGDSATGKTTLIDLLRDHANDRSGQTVTLISDVPCVVFGGDQSFWEVVLRSIQNSIVFIDEDYSFIYSQEFAGLVQKSSCYFVLITRRSLPNLPYSIREIYGIRTSGKYHFPEKIYHEFYPIHDVFGSAKGTGASVLITEDSHSGLQFFQKACPGIRCVSAAGNSSIYQTLLSLQQEGRLIVIADGAAFGAFVSAIVSFAKAQGRTMLYFPESFEWMILHSGVLQDPDIEEILSHPEDYIESSLFFSWERFFTDLLEKRTGGDPIRAYTKAELPLYYSEGRNRERLLQILPEELRRALLPE